jgi:hypothetical protein
MKRRLVLGLLVVLCALPVAACGGGGSAAGQGAAEVVPAGVPIYLSIDTDFEGEQIQQAQELLARFPGSSGLLGMLEAQLEEDGDVDFQNDIRPALGDRLDFVVLELPKDGGPTPVVGLLQPGDQAAFDALVEKTPAEDRPVVGEIDGWTALSNDQSTLDRFEQAREAGSLEESDEFNDAMEGLEEDALARIYIGPSALRDALAEGDASLPQLEQVFPLNGFGIALTAEDRGVRLQAAAKTEFGTENFEPELPSAVPGGAIAYFGFGNVADAIRGVLNRVGEQNPELDQQIAQLELVLGLSLDEDVLPIFEQETAIALYPGEAGSELPAFLLALRVDDEQQAVATVDQILERAGQFSDDVPQPTTTQLDGVEAREVALPDGTTILYGGVDGMLFATTDSGLASELVGDGPRLADDAAFQDAGEQAELPDEVESLGYVNLNAGAEYAFGRAEQAGETVPPQVAENVEPLAWLLFHSTREEDRSVASGFLALDE